MPPNAPQLRKEQGRAPASNRRRVAIRLELDWPYRRHCDVYSGAQQFARDADTWECVIDEFAEATLRRGSAKNPVYDGILARATPALAKEAARCRIPLVNLWYNSPVMERLPGVFASAAGMGQLAAEHLLERGFRRFACLTGRGEKFQKIESDAFHAVIRKAGCQCHCAVVECQFMENEKNWDAFQRTADQWVRAWAPPIGVFVTFPNMMGRCLADICRRRNIVVPDQAAIVASDNEPSLCLHPAPSLTCVEVTYEKVGYTAAKLLDRLMSGQTPIPRLHWIPPSGIIARQSTDFFAVEEPLVDAALRFISSNLQQPIQVNEVCSGVFCGRRTLERRFRAALGRSISEEILRLRMERAKRELASTNTSLKLIAGSVGFRDAKRMHEVFFRELGMSPSEYRQSMTS